MSGAKVGFDVAGFRSELGIRLAVARKRSGRTQTEIAEAIGVTRSALASIETGRQSCATDVLWRIAVVLQVNINELVPERARD